MQGARPTLAAVDLGAIRANFAEARRHAAEREVIAVVKADAYGHGVLPVVRTLLDAGCGRLAVMTVAEAAPLRDAGVDVPVLVLGGVHDPAEAREAAARGLTPVVHHAGHVALLRGAAGSTPIAVHVEVDSGMRRMGIAPSEAVALLEAVAGEPALELAGIYTHFARADEPDLGPSLEQLAAFRGVLEDAQARGVDPGLVHVAASGGLLADKALADALPAERAVRPGLMLYGASPAGHLAARLRPAMTLRTQVVAVRSVGTGDGVGYSAEFRAAAPTRVATLAIGYADGVPVAASNRGSVLIRGRRMPIAGRVSMDLVTVDAGDEPVAIGDEAILFGEGQGTRLPVEEAAEAAGTISYELLVRVGSRVPRVFIEG
ncbi:MAG: alanine racemase [Myxococcota bacterium]